MASASYISPTPKFLILLFLSATPIANIIAAIMKDTSATSTATGSHLYHIEAAAWFIWLQYQGARALTVPPARQLARVGTSAREVPGRQSIATAAAKRKQNFIASSLYMAMPI